MVAHFWHEDMSRFYERNRAVRTASMNQVRQHIITVELGAFIDMYFENLKENPLSG